MSDERTIKTALEAGQDFIKLLHASRYQLRCASSRLDVLANALVMAGNRDLASTLCHIGDTVRTIGDRLCAEHGEMLALDLDDNVAQIARNLDAMLSLPPGELDRRFGVTHTSTSSHESSVDALSERP